uniref:Uncharacterized protein n=1 Tax=Pseudomonas monteilii TaxID=76759 RepID=A0A6B7Q2E4_9PSED|nr:hypothetical protein [Pseudomonas monteilii]
MKARLAGWRFNIFLMHLRDAKLISHSVSASAQNVVRDSRK